jgi:hypothetical protein
VCVHTHNNTTHCARYRPRHNASPGVYTPILRYDENTHQAVLHSMRCVRVLGGCGVTDSACACAACVVCARGRA